MFTGEGDAITAGADGATLMLVGGQPLGECRMFWNSASSRQEHVEQTKADWQAGRFALPPDDHGQWIPLPGRHTPRHNACMSLFDKLFGGRHDDAPASRLPHQRQTAAAKSSAARDAAQLLRAPTALAQLGEEEAQTVVGFMTPRRFPAGTVLIRQGEAGDTGFMVLVLDGEVTVENMRVSRRSPVTLNVLGTGSLIGEMALVDGEARSATCTASTDVACAVLTREALEILIAEQPATGAKLMTAIAVRLAERLREVSQKLQVTAQLVQTLQQEIDALMPTSDKYR